MKIAFLSYNRDPSIPVIDNDGCPVTVRHYALGLGKLGHTVDIFANRVFPVLDNNSYLKIKFNEQREDVVNLCKNVTVTRVPAKQFLLTKEVTLTPSTADMPEIAESVVNVEFFKDRKLFAYDVVCIFHPLTSFGHILSGTVPLNKTILFPMLLSDEYKKYQSVSIIYEDMETLALKSVRMVFSCSENERETILNKGIEPEFVKVIYRGFDDTVFSHQEKDGFANKDGIIRIVCVGSIKPQKQQTQLIEIAKKLKNTGFNPIVTIVGENQSFVKDEYKLYYESILSTINALNLENNFVFTGGVSPSRIAELFKTNDIAVFPSVSESFGKAALEAICTGIPTILNDEVAAYKDFAQNGKNALFYKSTTESCVDLIQKVIATPSLYSQLSRAGSSTGKRFGWANVTSQLEKQLLNI